MKINRDYEAGIDLKDMFFHLLYRWRSLLAAALIGAILMGTFQFLRLTLTHREGKLTKAEKQYYVDLQEFRDKLRNAQNGVRNYTNLINDKNRYLENSVYIHLDSQDEWYAFKRYYIKVDQAILDALPQGLQEDPTDRVAAVYTSTLKNGLDAGEMEQLLGTGKREYIDELVGIGADGVSNTLTVSVIGASEEDVLRQLEYFDNRLHTVCGPKAQEVASHTLTLLDQDARSCIDGGLLSKQNEIDQQLVSWGDALREQQMALNEIEDEEEPRKPVGIKKFAAIGFILGAFVLAGIYAVKYIFSGLLRSGSELFEHYGLPIYGEYAKSRARTPGKGLDKLFEKWEFVHARNDAVVTDEIAAMLRERHEGKRVLLTGTVSQDKLREFGQRLQPKLADAVKLDTEGNFLAGGVAASRASKADAVVLVEEKHASRLQGVEREAEMLVMGSANVTGCVII